jgi:penicillin G amidase
MSVPSQLAKTSAAIGALLGGAVGGLWWHFLRRPLPKTKGSMRLEGLQGPVEIRRDRWGVPHIRADNPHDLFFGQGFCHGQDRLWQMDLFRRVASGRLSELAGEKGGLATDRFIRTVGLRRAAVAAVDEYDPELRAEVESYCAGVNAASRARPLPVEFQLVRMEFEPWTPVDIELLGKLLAFGMTTNWETELLRADMAREIGPERTARLDPQYPRGNPVIVRPGEGWQGNGVLLADQIDRIKASIGLAPQAAGSNNWAISGERSVTGAPLLAGDPHLPPTMPGIWYQQGLYLGDRFAWGAIPPGGPGLFMGQNNDVAISVTNTMPDVMDLFVERIEDGRYLFRDEWLPVETIEEEIAVRGRDDPERLEIRFTHHGPIVNEILGADPDPPLALSFGVLQLQAQTRAQMRVWEATSGDEVVKQTGEVKTLIQNLVWADRHGSIGYKTIGRIPVRNGDCPDVPRPGWTGEYEWDGWVPYEEMPELRDPDCGYLVTANNRIAAEDFPHHISSETYDGYRAQRIEQLILATDEHDLDSFQAMQVDLVSNLGMEVTRRLARLRPPGQREVNAIEALKSWDSALRPDSVAATIYQAFTLRLGRELARAVIRDRDLADRYLNRSTTAFLNHITSPWRWQSHLMNLWAEADDELIGRPWDDLVVDALRGALDELSQRFGPDPAGWRWGEVHRVRFDHPLGDSNPLISFLFSRSYPIGGNQETVPQTSYDPNDPFAAVVIPGWRFVADLANPERSRWQAPLGQSGQPGSRHYDDLPERWLEGRTQLMAGEGPWRTLTLEPA